MDWARSGLILLLAGVAGVIYLWSSAKKQPPTSQLQQPQETEQVCRVNMFLSRILILHRIVPDSLLRYYTLGLLTMSRLSECLINRERCRSNSYSIIAIHGLGSNVDWSWTWKDGNKCVHWLQDSNMLPKKVPKSRTMVYNYESRWHKDAPKTRIQLCGEELIHSVHSFRSESSKRPIVFIGHSLGGNVIVDVSICAYPAMHLTNLRYQGPSLCQR